jgi:hypothetical protein
MTCYVETFQSTLQLTIVSYETHVNDAKHPQFHPEVPLDNLIGAFDHHALRIPVAMGVLYPFICFLLSPLSAAATVALSSVTVVTNANRFRFFQPNRI